jgi:putative exosortase-associated protein (TIGR04073 family)
MRSCLILLSVAVAGLLATGCSGPQTKLGRGINNTMEIVRMGETQRAIEQSSLFDGANQGFDVGLVKGISKSLARTGVGLYEIVTFPIPTYDPVATSYLTPHPGFPDSYKPGLRDAQSLNTDDRIWFSGGTIMPWLPGNRFRVFDN